MNIVITTDMRSVRGRINAVQSMGALDGPGLRYVVFMQGCPLRCGCCHNPETWDVCGGTAVTAGEMTDRIARYRPYFGTRGGVTLSGGEPMLQPAFTYAVFALCKQRGIGTCLDTSGWLTVGTPPTDVLSVCDLVLLDVKYTNDADYRRYTGCSLDVPLRFLTAATERNVPVILRQVIIPGINDNEENIDRLAEIARAYSAVRGAELLPFRRLCHTKYEELGIPFRFCDVPEPTDAAVSALSTRFKKQFCY